MRRTVENWLLAACDPQTPRQAPADLSAADLTDALAAAKRHFVLGSVLQSISSWRCVNDAARAAAVKPFVDDQLRDVGRTLGLRQLGEQTAHALAAAGIPCCILKGEDFASRLYPLRTLRPYRDVDVLVPRAAYHDADHVIQSLGFDPLTPDRKYSFDDYGQISYVAKAAEQWSLELHWNLINSPAQRRQCSLTWEDLDFEAPVARPSAARQLTATSLLILAAVHACVGHRFDSLQQLCDLRQICRGAAGAIDVGRLMESCRRLHCETSVAWSLDILTRMFGSQEARDLAQRCRPTSRVKRSWGVLGRRTVLHPCATTSKLRRSLARIRLKNAA
jgi:hypothetical protein